MKLFSSYTFFVLSLLLMNCPALTQPETLDPIGQTHGGGGYTVTWDQPGEQLIIGCGTSVWVYDMHDPDNPLQVKKRPLLGIINESILQGNVLFVAATHDGIYALDYTSPNLDVIDHFSMKEMPGSAAYDMHIYNDTIYVADLSGVSMFSYDQSTGFTELGTFGPENAFGVYRRGDYIAVCAQQLPIISNGKVQVYSFRDLSVPIAEWTSPWINWVQDIQFADLRDDIIYVCGGPETALFNKSNFFALQFDGNHLVPIDTFSIVNGIPGIAQQNIVNMDSRNDTLFLATTAAWDINHIPLTHVAVLDASGLPQNKMVEIGMVSPGLWHFDVALMHGTPYAAISSEWLGVSINDVSELAFLDTLGFIPTGGWVKKCKVKDNKLWVCNEGYGLMVYHIDSLLFSNGFWCEAGTLHIHDLSDHFFSGDIEFLNDTLLLLNPNRVYNIKPWLTDGSPAMLEYKMTDSLNRPKSMLNFKNIQTNSGHRIVATSGDLFSKKLFIFDPFDFENNFADIFVENTNNECTGFTVSGDTVYYGKKHSGNRWYLIAAKVSNDMVSKIDSIQLKMPWGLLSFADVTGISVENNQIVLSYGKQIALFQWNDNRLEEVFTDFDPNRNIIDIILRNNKVYTADVFFGMKVYDISSNTGANLVAQTRGSGGWLNVFGSQAVTLDEHNNIYLCEFCTGVIIIEPYDVVSGKKEVPEQSSGSAFNVFPNPASDHFIVEFSDISNPVHLAVYDVLGNEIWKKQMKERTVTIQTGKWAKGFYTVKCILHNQVIESKKIMIQ